MKSHPQREPMSNPPYSHSELVERAARWLANTHNCPVVITEKAGGTEEPDALGFNSRGGTTLVECKTTKSDFQADLRKSVRRTLSKYGVGNRRYYLVPKELVNHAILNKPEGWGVLVCYKTRVEMRDNGEYFADANKTEEMGLLVSCIRCIAGVREPLTGVSVKVYNISDNADGKPRASLGIKPL